MTQANWDTRWNVQKQHIVWRETFYEVKFNILQKAYAHMRMAFVNKDTIIGANCVLADHVGKHGTATKFAEAIGDTSFKANKGIMNPMKDVRTVLAYTVRLPLIVVGLTGLLIQATGEAIVKLTQAIGQRFPIREEEDPVARNQARKEVIDGYLKNTQKG